MIASYETPKPALTPEYIAEHGAAQTAARTAFAVEWTAGQEEAALTEAEHAYDAVIGQILAAHLAGRKEASR